MFPVYIEMVGLGPVPIDADEIVQIDRDFGLGPKIYLRNNRWVITTPENIKRLEAIKPDIAQL